MYKTSKFNYYTKNSFSELLLYNTLVGTKSFIKIKAEDSNQIEKLLNNEICLEKIPTNFKEELIKNGFLVPCNQDEDEKVRSIYVNTVCFKKCLF